MESLSVFTDAYKSVLRACEELEAYYENIRDLTKLGAVSKELDAIEKDFSEVEGIVKGYLSGTSRSSAEDQTKRLREEITKREEELIRVEQEIERTVAEYEKQLAQNLKKKKPAPGPDQGTKTTSPSELRDRERESTSRSECFKETLLSRKSLQKQDFVAQTQPVVSSCTQIPNASTTTGMVAGLPPPSFPGNVYTSTPLVPFYPSISVPPVSSSVEQQLQLQQPTSATPVVSVQSLMNQSHVSPFPTVSTSSPSVYVPSLMQQLPFSGGQGQFMPTGRNQSSPLSTADQISADSSALLKRVSVPKFFGQKKNYEAWKAAFYSCVDRTGATPEYKLLRLRECLQGERLRVIENLGHSEAAYEAAKSRLERTYGGKRRALTLRLEELNAFKPVREGNERDLEKFSEPLDGIVVNLKDINQEAEPGN